MENKFIVFILIIVVLAAAWTAHQNPNPSGGNLFGISSNQQHSSSGGNTTGSIQNNLDQAQSQADQIQKEIDAEKARQEASPLASDIAFYQGNAWSSDANNEYVYFTLSPSHQGKVLISGFKLQSTATGKTAIIGEGVPLIFSGQINEKEPIFISPGDKVVIATGISPLGYSFQINKCGGYLAKNQTFYPYIPARCPLAQDEPMPLPPNNLSDACLDYINNLQSCDMPDPSTLLHSTLSESQCYNFIVDHLNYNTCVNEHKNDRDFYPHEWRVYLGYTSELWKSRREVIKLLDLNGKTIGTLTY